VAGFSARVLARLEKVDWISVFHILLVLVFKSFGDSISSSWISSLGIHAEK
jgi:hypothetical protein